MSEDDEPRAARGPHPGAPGDRRPPRRAAAGPRPPPPRGVILAGEIDAARRDRRLLVFALVTVADAETVLRGGADGVVRAEAALRQRLTAGAGVRRVEPFGDLLFGVFLDAEGPEVVAWAERLSAAGPPAPRRRRAGDGRRRTSSAPPPRRPSRAPTSARSSASSPPEPMLVVTIVLDGAGVGDAPDADAYGDAGADTLGHVVAQPDSRPCPT